jgi:hypothetical protein
MLKPILNWLARADVPSEADLIFVLAGLQSRKAYALGLFHQRLAPQILLSTGRFEIRRFAGLNLPGRVDLLKRVEKIPPPKRHFFVSFKSENIQVQRISLGALGTLSEMEALRDWLRERPELTSVSIVSSPLHLRRLRICSKFLLPHGIKTSFVAVPEENADLLRLCGWRKSAPRKTVPLELLKIFCYCVLLPIRRLSPVRSRLDPSFIS